MSPKISPKTVAIADVVSLTAVSGKIHSNIAVMFEFVSFFDIKIDCVIDFGMPSGSTLNVYLALSPATGPIAEICCFNVYMI